jgi:pantetheine-phosphate adenylyltransferase
MTRASRGSLAVFPGSFDPITNGHLDIIARGLHVFDRVRVAILVNSEKQPLFTVEERVSLIREAYKREPRVSVDTFSGLLVAYARKVGASVIVRGIRALSDFEYEFQMALMNRRLDPRIETVFMMPAESYSYLSSRLVKEVFQLGGRVTELVPAMVEERLCEKYGMMPPTKGARSRKQTKEMRAPARALASTKIVGAPGLAPASTRLRKRG